MVAVGFLLFWFVLIVVAGAWAAGIHGAMFGIEEVRMEQFTYDAKMLNYFLMGAFKLAAFMLFLTPWLVLRFGRASKVES